MLYRYFKNSHLLLAFMGALFISIPAPSFATESLVNMKNTPLKIAEEFKNELAAQESSYQLSLQLDGFMDKKKVYIFRYQKEAAKVNLAHAHVSLVVDDAGKLKGITRMNPALESTAQVSKDKAEAVARTFLAHYAPDLLENLKLQWVDPHEEVILTEAGKKVVLTGMKVKCRDSKTGLYFWVIVAADASVMVFERDINWNFIKGGRQTEKWLHDAWLAEKIAL